MPSVFEQVAALLGVSAHRLPSIRAHGNLPSLGDDAVDSVRERHGGQLAPLTVGRTRWYPKDIETASRLADTGDLTTAAQLMRAANADGVYTGVMSTRTGGLVHLRESFPRRSRDCCCVEGVPG